MNEHASDIRVAAAKNQKIDEELQRKIDKFRFLREQLLKTSGEIEAAVAAMSHEQFVTRSAIEGRWDIINTNNKLTRDFKADVPTVIVRVPSVKEEQEQTAAQKARTVTEQPPQAFIAKKAEAPPAVAPEKMEKMEKRAEEKQKEAAEQDPYMTSGTSSLSQTAPSAAAPAPPVNQTTAAVVAAVEVNKTAEIVTAAEPPKNTNVAQVAKTEDVAKPVAPPKAAEPAKLIDPKPAANVTSAAAQAALVTPAQPANQTQALASAPSNQTAAQQSTNTLKSEEPLKSIQTQGAIELAAKKEKIEKATEKAIQSVDE